MSGIDAGTLQRAYQATSRAGWAALGIGALAAIGLEAWPAWVLFAPFLVSAVLIGLPHGALDHLVWLHEVPRPHRARSMLEFLVGYIALALGFLALWFAAPLLGIGLFLLLTLYHWGDGDAQVLRAREGGAYLESRLERTLAVILRGGLPMLLPFLFHPGASLEVVRALAGLFHAGDAVPAALAVEGRAVAGAGFLVVASFYYFRKIFPERKFRNSRAAWTDLFESGLLAVFFAVTPPVFALGLYFVFWHSLRHMARLFAWRERAVAAGNAPGPAAVARLLRESVPLTAAALALTALLALAVALEPVHASSWLALYLVFIAAVTFPHALVVAWMNRQEARPETFSQPRQRFTQTKETNHA